MRRVTLAAVVVSLVLVGLKAYGWWLTGALSLLSALADSFFDVVMSTINFFALRYALKPADDEHRFGHNSMEDIAGLVQFSFICGSMLFVVFHAVQRISDPQPLVMPEYGAGIMAISLLLTSALVFYQRWIAKRTGSLIIQADSLHYLGDILMNIGIIGSLFIIAYTGLHWIDTVIAISVAIYIIREAFEIGIRAFDNLMDKEMPEEEKQTIVKMIQATDGLKGYHNLKTRYSGTKPFIQMHVELDKELSFKQAHDIAEALENALFKRFPHADIIIHQDPV